ncbi:hypothetical protein EUTSA_v10009897mg [Eutrema salsugineum]|uniref:F-box domain-containing protein n=1 Tax=Eutrema salsugineum TaxID=72664 RepID=V4K6V6_EUTSA|nr:putative F-box/kelch-repeat protein At2g29810 [Eutrema salsugineum]ESQ33330.1 hypothetical protein EUTSA_v10009897mg [Eutrema salsugineum]
MVEITEIPDESNGGDPNKKPENLEKKPQDEEAHHPEEPEEDDKEANQNEKPKVEEDEQVKNQNEKPQEHNLGISLTDLPDDIIESILAKTRRSNYPTLQVVSRILDVFISSPRLYETRLTRGLDESVLYALIGFPPHDPPSWYILHRVNKISRLCRIGCSLPPIPFGSAVVTIGPEIYVIGGSYGQYIHTSGVIVIDCRSHKHRWLQNMRRVRYCAAAGVIDGKIYVIGGCEKRYQDWDWIEVFDLETQVWDTVRGPYPYASWNWKKGYVPGSSEFVTHVVMNEKIYVKDPAGCFVYEPRERKWFWENQAGSLWLRPCCVVDDLLYSIDCLRTLGHLLVVYDPKEKIWGPVSGLDDGLPNLFYNVSSVANRGGKLVILGASQYIDSWSWPRAEIWCVEISLKRREYGEVWGKVESLKRVLTPNLFPAIELCRFVTI